MNVIQAWGCLAPIREICDALRTLNVGYVEISRDRNRVHNTGCSQPAWPVVVPNIQMAQRYNCKKDRQILFICDSAAALQTINVQLLNPATTLYSVRQALELSVRNPINWVYENKELSYAEYVKLATKPSFLNDLQAEIYSLNPYDLQKSVRGQVIAYLANTETRAKLMAKLNSSYKLDKIKSLIESPKCDKLKDAALRVQKGEDEHAVALATGFEPFELLYIVRSDAKTKAGK